MKRNRKSRPKSRNVNEQIIDIDGSITVCLWALARSSMSGTIYLDANQDGRLTLLE